MSSLDAISTQLAVHHFNVKYEYSEFLSETSIFSNVFHNGNVIRVRKYSRRFEYVMKIVNGNCALEKHKVNQNLISRTVEHLYFIIV